MVMDRGESGEPRESSARARRSWPVRKHLLGREPGDDLRASTTAEERLAMMWPLAVAAWSLSGAGIPDYVRGDTPVRMDRRTA